MSCEPFDLDRLRRLRAARAKLHEQRGELALSRAYSPPSAALDGMPRRHGWIRRGGEDNAIRLADLDSRILDLDLQIIRAEIQFHQFLSTVSDARMRLILRYRFLDGLTWKEVAQKISKSETPEAVKASCRRFLRGTATCIGPSGGE